MGPGDMASAAGTEAPVAGGPVTRWSLAADRLGRGAANWRTQAIMHKAMPRRAQRRGAALRSLGAGGRRRAAARWRRPRVAMAAAAYQVLLAPPGAGACEADRLFRDACARGGAGPRDQQRHPLGRLDRARQRGASCRADRLPRPFP